MKTEDGYIINKCLNGDSSAFGLLVDKYKAGVYALAYSRIQNFHDAEDITQEVFIRAYQKLRTLKKTDNFLTWLYTITSNLCNDWHRDNLKRIDTDHIDDQPSETLDSYSLRYYKEQAIYEKLNDALKSLPETYKTILILYYLGGMDSPEIAEMLGMSPEAVRQRLSRSRDKLREEMIDFVKEAFDKKKLKASFTFRIVEQIKRLKISPDPNANGLPYSLSIATGLILVFMLFGHHVLPVNFYSEALSSSLFGGITKIKQGEFFIKVISINGHSLGQTKKGRGSSVIAKKTSKKSGFTMSDQSIAGKWVSQTEMPTARLAFDSISLGDKIYLIGGLRNGWEPISTVEVYDPSSKRWTRKAGMPTSRYGHSVSEVNGKIYAIGGETIVGPKVLSVVEEYDPEKNEWTRKADMPTPRSGHSACVYDDKIYVFGGTASDFLSALSVVEVYDPNADEWQKKTDMPIARSGMAVEVVKGKIYVIGGTADLYGPYNGRILGIVEEYDPKTNKWTRKTDMPTPRSGFSSCVLNNKIIVIGGISDQMPGVPTAIVEEYDPSLDIWIKRPDMPTNRFALSTVAVKGRVFAMGGLQIITEGFKGLSTVEEYMPEK